FPARHLHISLAFAAQRQVLRDEVLQPGAEREVPIALLHDYRRGGLPVLGGVRIVRADPAVEREALAGGVRPDQGYIARLSLDDFVEARRVGADLAEVGIRHLDGKIAMELVAP